MFVSQEKNELEVKKPITVRLQLEKSSFIEVSLFSGNGDLVYNFSDYRGAGDFLHIIKLKELNKGSYWLRLGVDGKTSLREVFI